MAVGRTKKITRKQAGSYERSTPNGMGVTAIASVNGRGSYASRYAETKAILSGRKPSKLASLRPSARKSVKQLMNEAKRAVALGKKSGAMKFRRKAHPNGALFDSLKSAGRSTVTKARKYAPVVASGAKRSGNRVAELIRQANRSLQLPFGAAKPSRLRTRSGAVALLPSSKKTTKSRQVPHLVAHKKTTRKTTRVMPRGYEENMPRRRHRRARANARSRRYKSNVSLAELMAEAKKTVVPAHESPAHAPKRGRGRPKLTEEQKALRAAAVKPAKTAKRAKRAGKLTGAQKAANKEARKLAGIVAAESRKAARAAAKEARAIARAEHKKLPKAARRTPKSARKMVARATNRLRSILGGYRPRTKPGVSKKKIQHDLVRLAHDSRAYLVNPRRRKHKASRRHHYKTNLRRHYSRNESMLESLKGALKVGAIAAVGFVAHRGLTNLLSDQFAKLDTFKDGANGAKYRRVLSAAVVAAVGVPAMKFTEKFVKQEQRTAVQAGMIVSLFQAAIVDLLVATDNDKAKKVSGYFAAYPEAYRGYGEYLTTGTNGMGEYLATNGMGEYLATNGTGEYLATNGMGQYAQAAAGLGGPISQAAAGYGQFTQAAAGVGGSMYEGIMPNTESAEYALSVAEATAGVGAYGNIDEVSTVNPTDMALPIDDGVQELRSGVLEGGDGIFG